MATSGSHFYNNNVYWHNHDGSEGGRIKIGSVVNSNKTLWNVGISIETANNSSSGIAFVDRTKSKSNVPIGYATSDHLLRLASIGQINCGASNNYSGQNICVRTVNNAWYSWGIVHYSWNWRWYASGILVAISNSLPSGYHDGWSDKNAYIVAYWNP